MTSSFLHSLKLEMYSSPWCVFFQPSSSFCSPWVPVDSLSLTMEEIRIWGLFCLWSCRCLLASCWMNFGMGTKDGRLFLEKAISVEWVDVLIQLLRGIRDAWGIQKLADLCSYLDIKALVPVFQLLLGILKQQRFCPKVGRAKQEPWHMGEQESWRGQAFLPGRWQELSPSSC